MAGLGRYVDVLRLFDTTTSGGAESWSVVAIASALDAPASTLYRTVRELTKAGFLEQAGDAQYSLGPAFIEYERLLRINDPLVRTGRGILGDLVRQAGLPCVALMARLYNGEVMCIADEAAPGTDFHSSYERGRPMPMTRGATSKIILAHRPSRELTKLIGPRAATAQLRRELQTIRRAGHVVTASEIDPGLTGIAAPIIAADPGASASLTLVVRESTLDEATRRRLVLLVVSSSSLLAEEIRKAHSKPARVRADSKPDDTARSAAPKSKRRK